MLINDNQAFPVVSDPGDGALTWYMRGNGSDADVFGRTPFTGGGGGGTDSVSIDVSPTSITVGQITTINITVDTTADASSVVVMRGDVEVGRSTTAGRSWSFTDTLLKNSTMIVVYRVVAVIGGVEKTAQTGVNVQKQPTELSWSQSSYNATIGGSNTFPTLSGATGLTITYSSSNQSVATINSSGVVTLVGAGSCTITASYAGDEIHQAATATYTLNVSEQRLTVQIGHGTSYATAQFTDTGETLSNNMHVNIDNNAGDYLFIKVDKRDTVNNLYLYNPGAGIFEYMEIALNVSIIDGNYKYYQSTNRYNAGIAQYVINKV